MQVGIGYTSREVCDGQGLGCLVVGRQPTGGGYPTGSRWEPVAKLLMDFARSHGTTDLLTRLALGQVPSSPFVPEKIAVLKSKIIDYRSTQGIHLQRTTEDRSDLQRKEKPGGVITARVLFDGSNGIYVTRRTRIRDEERSPIASDIKRLMREKSQLNQRSFSLTAHVSEAHRQVPIHPSDWHMLGCRIRNGQPIREYCRHVRGGIGIILLVACCLSHREDCTVLHRDTSDYVASPCRG